MKLLKPLIIAFSMYSNIPMPQFAWKDEDMRYVMCFFPWVGIVIGLCVYGWGLICQWMEIGSMAYTMIGGAIPLLLTGGFHVDGFLDTMDAFHSYQPKEKKLEILKDAHIGAFAVIMFGVYGLIYLGAFSEVRDLEILKILCCGFLLSRVLSGLSVVLFPKAKKDGLLQMFASRAQKQIVTVALGVQGSVCISLMLLQSLPVGGLLVLSAFGAFGYYYFRTKKELGGINGDTAGYFVCICECSMAVAAGILSVVWR